MKHLKKILAIACLVSSAAFVFAACESAPAEKPLPDHEHTFSEEWKKDGSEHWHEATCGHTGEQSGRAAHTFTESTEGTADCTHGVTTVKTCSVCGYSVTVQGEPLGHSWENIPELPATCETDGHTAYRRCSVCGEREGYQLLMKTNRHIYDTTAWEFNDTTHWHPAICGCTRRSGEARHSYNEETATCECGFVDPDADQDKQTKALFVLERGGNNYAVTGLTEAGKVAKTLTLPSTYLTKNVTAIGAGAFVGSTATEITLPDTVTSIGDFAFQGCTALVTIHIPEKLTKLGTTDYQVFNGCTHLSAISLPKGITYIGQNTFKGCTALATVTLAGNVTMVDTQAFYGCSSLSALTLSGSLSYIGQKAFAGSGLEELSVTMASGGRIAQGAFEKCAQLTTLSIAGGINYFASPILSGCERLTTLTIPFVGNHVQAEKATDIHFGYLFGKKAEGGYAIPAALTTVNVTGGSVQRGAFDGCKAITVNADDKVDVKTKTFADYTGTFNWTGTLPGPELSAVTASKTSGVAVGEQVQLTFTAAEGSVITLSVTKEGLDAAGKFQYDSGTKKISFNEAGDFVVTVTASYNGHEEHKDVSINVADSERSLTLNTATVNGWVRAEKGKDVVIEYTATGSFSGYTASVTEGGQLDDAAHRLTVKSDACDTKVYTVTYTKETDSITLEVKVSFVSDVESAPVLGEDPFGGTYGVLYAATGLQLYYDVTDGAEGGQLALGEISFAAGSLNTTGVALTVEHIAHEEAQPFYTITEDWTEGNHTGNVSIKLTATKNGQTAAATKEFEVKALSDPNSSSGMNAYIDEVMKEKGGRGALDLDSGLSRGKRENMIIAKDGIYEHRTGDNWGNTGDFFCVKVENKDNFQLDFDFRIVKRINDDQKISFLVNYRGAGWDDWVGEGDTEFYSQDGANAPLSIYSSLQSTGDTSWDDNGNKPNQDNTIVHLRLKHTVEEAAGKVWFEWTWSYSTDYHPLFKYSANKTEENGKNGSSIHAICFRHSLGSIFFGNFKLTTLGA